MGGAYTGERIETRKRKAGGGLHPGTDKNTKKKTGWGLLQGRTQTRKTKAAGGLHQGMYRNKKKKGWRGLTPQGVDKQDKKSGRGPITCSIMEMLILVVTYIYINRLSYLTLDKEKW